MEITREPRLRASLRMIRHSGQLTVSNTSANRKASGRSLLAAPMLLIELWLMSSMYPDRRRNLILAALTLAFMLFCWWGIRTQAAVTDKQFIRSMIPHHAGAILMCEENRLKDPELVKLCQDIITSQTQEIAQMKQLLAERSR